MADTTGSNTAQQPQIPGAQNAKADFLGNLLPFLLVGLLTVWLVAGTISRKDDARRRDLDRTGAEVVELAELDGADPHDLPALTLRSLEHRKKGNDYDWSAWRTQGVLRATNGGWCGALVLEPNGDKPYTITDCDEVPAGRTGQ